jgi:threonine dehydrogenase-like Zn-dependent dehydrogenase
MSKSILMHENGGPEKMQLHDVEVGSPGPGQVKIRHTAIGLNFIDVYTRSGLYQTPMPNAVGREAAGVIVEVGPKVKGFKKGDRVAIYADLHGGTELHSISSLMQYRRPFWTTDDGTTHVGGFYWEEAEAGGVSIAATWLIEGFVLGIVAYLHALFVAVLAIVVAWIVAAYVNRQHEEEERVS